MKLESRKGVIARRRLTLCDDEKHAIAEYWIHDRLVDLAVLQFRRPVDLPALNICAHCRQSLDGDHYVLIHDGEVYCEDCFL